MKRSKVFLRAQLLDTIPRRRLRQLAKSLGLKPGRNKWDTVQRLAPAVTVKLLINKLR